MLMTRHCVCVCVPPLPSNAKTAWLIKCARLRLSCANCDMLHSEGSLVRGSDGATEVHSLMAQVFKPGQSGVPAKKKKKLTPWKHFSHLSREVVYPHLPADPGHPPAPGSWGVQRVKIIAIIGWWAIHRDLSCLPEKASQLRNAAQVTLSSQNTQLTVEYNMICSLSRYWGYDSI